MENMSGGCGFTGDLTDAESFLTFGESRTKYTEESGGVECRGYAKNEERPVHG